MFSSEWSAALSSLLPQYSYISTSVAQSGVNQSHRHQQMSQPAEVAERGFCLFVICHSRDTSLKSPPASGLDCLCCVLGNSQRGLVTFANVPKQPGLLSASHCALFSLMPRSLGFLVVKQKNKIITKKPWDLWSNAAKCWVPSVPTGTELVGCGPSARKCHRCEERRPGCISGLGTLWF